MGEHKKDTKIITKTTGDTEAALEFVKVLGDMKTSLINELVSRLEEYSTDEELIFKSDDQPVKGEHGFWFGKKSWTGLSIGFLFNRTFKDTFISIKLPGNKKISAYKGLRKLLNEELGEGESLPDYWIWADFAEEDYYAWSKGASAWAGIKREFETKDFIIKQIKPVIKILNKFFSK